MLDPVRQEVATTSRTIVVKVGTRVLTHEDGSLDNERVTAIAEQLVWLIEEQRQVVLVSSGAVGAGIGALGCDGGLQTLAICRQLQPSGRAD